MQDSGENSEDFFVILHKGAHRHLLNFLSLEESIAVLMTCVALHEKYKMLILEKLIEKARTQRIPPDLLLIYDAIKLSGLHLDYSHIARIMSCARPLLSTILKHDVDCAWKLFAICGLNSDVYHREAMDYYALGGQLECLQKHIQQLQIPFRQPRDDPERNLARMAAIGGHCKILQYLKNVLSYDLHKTFPVATKEDDDATLLTFAAQNGQSVTIDFLLEIGLDPLIGKNLAQIAAANGHWELYDKLSLHRFPIADNDDALSIAKDAMRTGNLELAKKIIRQNKLDVKKLRYAAIEGGHASTFWYLVEIKCLSVRMRFTGRVAIEHILAREGHLALLIQVLDCKKRKGVADSIYAVDEEKKSVLHYSAEGGHRTIYNYLLRNSEPAKFNLIDNKGHSVAEIAAQARSVWMLQHLQNTDQKSAVRPANNDTENSPKLL